MALMTRCLIYAWSQSYLFKFIGCVLFFFVFAFGIMYLRLCLNIFLLYLLSKVSFSFLWSQFGVMHLFIVFFCRGYVGIHSSGFRDFLLKPELLRAIVDSGFEHPSEGNFFYSIIGYPR